MTVFVNAKKATSIVLACWIFPLTTSLLLLFNESLAHWFIVPVTICGIVIGADAIHWIRHKFDVFDPVGIVGIYGVFFFYLAPIFHPITDFWLASVSPPPDWRTWLGYMATLNIFGLVAYRLGLAYVLSKPIFRKMKFTFNRKKLASLAFILLPFLIALQFFVYQSFGGFEGYIASAIAPDAESNMQGLGVIFLVSESFPMLALIIYLGLRRPTLMSWPQIAFVLFVYLMLALFFGGLRGSRSNTVWGLFFAVSAIHFWVRPINKKVVLVGIAFLALFMYVYGFFKAGGIETLTLAFESSVERSAIEQKHTRSTTSLLLGDLGRSDVQSFILYRQYGLPSNEDLALGRTYIGALALLIPSSIWPNRPLTKVVEGTNTLHGAGSYSPNVLSASNVYGLAGETLLNFGALAVPFAFLLWGVIVGKVKAFAESLDINDAHRLLVPILINFCVVILISDSDNIVFFVFKNLIIPYVLIWYCSKKSSKF